MPTEQKQIVLILSTMRSGSTLLKALLGSAPDVSSLPEIDFQRYQGNNAAERIGGLSSKPIIALKRPAWFNEINRYPKLPNLKVHKRIILARDVAANVLSLRKMAFGKCEPIIPKWMDVTLANLYWARVYLNLIKKFPKDDSSNFWIRYEDLLENPIEWTQRLFAFIGSEQKQGIDSYHKPRRFKWSWGTDDGSDIIRSLRVQPPRAPDERAIRMMRRLRRSPDVIRARNELGYLLPADAKSSGSSES